MLPDYEQMHKTSEHKEKNQVEILKKIQAELAGQNTKL